MTTGPRTAFAVIFTESDEDGLGRAVARLRREFPGHLELVSRTVYLVRHDGLSSDVSKRVGIKGDERTADGVVFRLAVGSSGYTKRELWEWLDNLEH